MSKRRAKEQKRIYSDEEINQLAEWIGDLTIAQAMFVRELYLKTLNAKAIELGQVYVH